MNADAFPGLLRGVRQTGPDRYEALCPAHGEPAPCLHVHADPNDRIRLWCHAGCTLSAVLDSLGLPAAALETHGVSGVNETDAPR